MSHNCMVRVRSCAVPARQLMEHREKRPLMHTAGPGMQRSTAALLAPSIGHGEVVPSWDGNPSACGSAGAQRAEDSAPHTAGTPAPRFPHECFVNVFHSVLRVLYCCFHLFLMMGGVYNCCASPQHPERKQRAAAQQGQNADWEGMGSCPHR